MRKTAGSIAWNGKQEKMEGRMEERRKTYRRGHRGAAELTENGENLAEQRMTLQ